MPIPNMAKIAELINMFRKLNKVKKASGARKLNIAEITIKTKTICVV